MLGCRQSWPAILILGISVLVLAMALKSGQADMPVQPTWLMGVAAGLYVVLALVMCGANWRWPVTTAVMAAGHVLLAVFMGWGYSAVEGQGRDAYGALLHGLWDYVPGTALQAGFAVALGAVTAAWLARPQPEPGPAEPSEEVEGLPDLSLAGGPQEAVGMACEAPGVGAALIAQEDAVFGAGAWQRDPGAALGRVHALAKLTGTGLNTYPCHGAELLVRWEGQHTVALLATTRLPGELAHELLRDLWAWEMVAEVPEADG